MQYLKRMVKDNVLFTKVILKFKPVTLFWGIILTLLFTDVVYHNRCDRGMADAGF